MTNIGSYNSPLKTKDGELILKGKVQTNEEFKAPLTISHEFEVSPLTGTVTATTQQVIGTGTKFKSELSTFDSIVVNGTVYVVASIPTDTMLFVSPGQTTQFTDAEFAKLTNPLEGGSLLELKYGDAEAQPLFRISPAGDVVLSGNVQADRVTADRINATTIAGEHIGTLNSGISATTQTEDDNSTKVATTEFVKNEIAYSKTVSPRLQGLNTSDSLQQTDIELFIYQGAGDAVLTIESTLNVKRIKVINVSTTGDVTFAAGDGVMIKHGGTGKLPKMGTQNRELWSCDLIEDFNTTNAWIITDLYTGL